MTAPASASFDETLAELARTVSTLLSLLGVDANRQKLYEALVDDSSMERIAAELERRGIETRVVEVLPSDLPLLRTPTLLALKGGMTGLLLSASSSSAELLDIQGRPHTLTLAGLGREFPARALELSELAKGGTSFLPRFFVQLAREGALLRRLLVLSLVSLALGFAVPALTRQVLDRALPDGTQSLLMLVALAVPIVALHRALLEALRQALARALDARLVRALVSALMKHLIRLPFLELQRRPTHELLQALLSSESLAQLWLRSALLPTVEAALALVYLVVLARELPLVALTVLGVGTAILLVSLWTARLLGHLQREKIAASARQNGFLYEMLAGALTIKSAGAERASVGRWLERLVDERSLEMQSARVLQNCRVAVSLFTRASGLALFAWGGHACLVEGLSLGAFMASAMYADSYVGAISRLSAALIGLWTSRVHQTRLDELLAIEQEQRTIEGGCDLFGDGDAIVVNDVWFRHGPGQPWVIRGQSLRVRRGSVLTLRSASGAGKTTLLRLIAGLYVPERGQLSVEGRDPREVRDLITYLPQQAHLFEGSILHNLKLLSGASGERVLEAAAQTGLIEWVSSVPMGLETLVSAGGRNISGGQRQWIAITAAAASDRPIVLLDEAMCHMDRLTRARVLAGDLFRKKTVIHVTHELDEQL